jgi:DNA-binding response OmpR family regulator/HPt (histidine-containing phosphotransfer) domain-containing protein
MQILLIEDDQPTSAVLTASLRAQHYQVSTALDGQAGLDLAQQFEYNLILLDVELPKLDGISLCQALRDQGNATPILLLTARESATDRILGLDAGADDYVIKPFDLAELMARVRALLRRSRVTPAALVTWENLCLDPVSREVRADGQILHLTPKEYGLLELFLSTPNRVFSRSAILDRLWNPGESPGEETVSTHIKCLRQKLEAAGVANPIRTVHGVGYRLRSSDESNQEQRDKKPKARPERLAPEQAAQAITTRVWQQSAHKLLAQVDQIEQATTALVQHCLTPELRAQAAQAAHKLAGSLGIFGLHEGSELAKQLEDWLQPQVLLDDLQAAQLQDWVQKIYRSLPPADFAQIQAIPQMPDLPIVLAILTDCSLIEQLADLASTWRLRIKTATPETAQARRSQTCPDAILLDLDWQGPDQGPDQRPDQRPDQGTDQARTLLDCLIQPDLYPQPLIALSGQESLQNRLAITELGGVFLQKPASVPDIFHAITHVLERQLSVSNRVMVVDDDPQIATWLSSLLQPFEIQVTGIHQPEQFWQILQTVSPDLLILDAEMPLLNGWQLCQMVRSDLKWQHLPILFFSNHNNVDQIDRAFQAGADDYFYKSSRQNGAELVERILRRLKRASKNPTIEGKISGKLDAQPLQPPIQRPIQPQDNSA